MSAMGERLLVLFVAASLSAGCAEETDNVVGESVDEIEEALRGDNSIEMNGAKLNSIHVNSFRLNSIHVNGFAVANVHASGGVLSGTRADTGATVSGAAFVGASIPVVLADGSQRLAVVTGMAQDSTSGLSKYTVTYSAGGVVTNICSGGGHAIPLEGIWNDLGEHVSVSDQFTFACSGGALAKCVEWGYRQWESRQECVDQSCQPVPLSVLHQACTRMVRADYCGDGKHHTVNGTMIDVWDTLGIQTQTTGTCMAFEAEWGVDGAHCIRHTRWSNADGSDPDKAYILAHCPERWNGDGKATDCDNDSNFFTSVGFDEPITSRRVLRSASALTNRR